MNSIRLIVSAAAATFLLAPPVTVVEAQPAPIKIGIIWAYSGSDPNAAKALDTALAAYMKEHGDTIAGRKLVIVRRDSGTPNPEVARRLAQELIVTDGVDFIAGVAFTPEGLAIAPVSTAGKKPVLIVNAAGTNLMAQAPYMARFSGTNGQMAVPLAQWATKNGIKTSFNLVSDYGPGLDASAAFTKAFTAGGGTSLGEVRPPLSNTDFAAYVQRIKDAKPDSVFVFLPAGPPSVRFLKAFHDAGLEKTTKILAIGNVVDDDTLAGLGDAAAGVISAYYYSSTHDSPLNRQFVRDFKAIQGSDAIPNFAAIGAYDALAAIYRIVNDQKGGTDPDKAMMTLKAYKVESPRGPISIDPDTRDIVQNVYIRRVDTKNGVLQNTEIATYPAVKDPLEH